MSHDRHDRDAEALAAASRAFGVRDPRVLAAMRTVPRRAYVPRGSESLAGRDEPIGIGHGQVTSQPSLVACMVEALALEGDETVLEVGTGFGYQAAILAQLAREVWTIELIPELAASARANLQAQGVANAHVVAGDGTLGLPEHGPFDAIVLAAAFPEVPPPLVEQLVEGGRLVQPIGPGGYEEVMLFERRPEGLRRARMLTGARFVRLFGRHGYRKDGLS
jgi:protein-L-isoaspartate(D-aspartate) O-methyltransferase